MINAEEARRLTMLSAETKIEVAVHAAAAEGYNSTEITSTNPNLINEIWSLLVENGFKVTKKSLNTINFEW